MVLPKCLRHTTVQKVFSLLWYSNFPSFELRSLNLFQHDNVIHEDLVSCRISAKHQNLMKSISRRGGMKNEGLHLEFFVHSTDMDVMVRVPQIFGNIMHYKSHFRLIMLLHYTIDHYSPSQFLKSACWFPCGLQRHQIKLNR